MKLDDVDVPVIGLDALLKNKEASGRTKDHLDVEAIDNTPAEDNDKDT